MHTNDEHVGSIGSFLLLFFLFQFSYHFLACEVSLSDGSVVFAELGATGFAPSTPATCTSYISAGPRVALEENISSFSFVNPKAIRAGYEVTPYYTLHENAMIMQLGMIGSNATASATCYLMSPSQLSWQASTICGPGTARYVQVGKNRPEKK
jgi:hypothetical protein